MAEVSNGRANLHLHTIFSDGELQPAEVVDAHAAAGFSAIALTDHDTLAGIDALGGLEGRPLRIVAGVELSIEDQPGRGLIDVHLLGYGFALGDRRLRRGIHGLVTKLSASSPGRVSTTMDAPILASPAMTTFQ